MLMNFKRKHLGVFLISFLILSNLSVAQKVKANVVMRLSGNFSGKGQGEAIIHNVGKNSIQINVDGRPWINTEFNFNATRGKCVTGLFSGSGRTDIACMYDYGNFNVGFVVFTSMGQSFNVGTWWTSGPGNMNPDMVGELRAGDFAHTGATGLRFSYSYPEGPGYITLKSDGSRFIMDKVER